MRVRLREGRDEDALAFFRDAPAFVNLTLAEQPNGRLRSNDCAAILVGRMAARGVRGSVGSSDTRLASVAAKAIKETATTQVQLGLAGAVWGTGPRRVIAGCRRR